MMGRPVKVEAMRAYVERSSARAVARKIEVGKHADRSVPDVDRSRVRLRGDALRRIPLRKFALGGRLEPAFESVEKARKRRSLARALRALVKAFAFACERDRRHRNVGSRSNVDEHDAGQLLRPLGEFDGGNVARAEDRFGRRRDGVAQQADQLRPDLYEVGRACPQVRIVEIFERGGNLSGRRANG